jgi:hypothetical protein
MAYFWRRPTVLKIVQCTEQQTVLSFPLHMQKIFHIHFVDHISVYLWYILTVKISYPCPSFNWAPRHERIGGVEV